MFFSSVNTKLQAALPPPLMIEPPLGFGPLQFKDFTPQVIGAFFPVWEKFE